MAALRRFSSVGDAIRWTAQRRREGARVGSMHTLGALHIGHGLVMGRMSAENDEAVVSIYPNPSQLAPGATYQYDVEADVAMAEAHGVTAVITPAASEMFPPYHRTFLDQGDCYARMDGVVVPYLFRGMITMSFRWVNALRPDSTYWGMKDIGQCLLLERALHDFMVPVEVRRIPCVRTKSGLPVSSRLRVLDNSGRADVARLYRALEGGRLACGLAHATRDTVVQAMRDVLACDPFEQFTLRYIDCFDPLDFASPRHIAPPLILHGAISRDGLNHFDGLLLACEADLREGPVMTWIDDTAFGQASA